MVGQGFESPLRLSRPRLSHPGPSVDLLWIPLGAGAHVVRLSGKVYETLKAAGRRPRAPLFHSALIVQLPDGPSAGRWVIESAPVPDADREARGVVAGGPVGLRRAGRFRIFRYEIRRWRDGVLPDERFAVGEPVRVTDDAPTAERILALVPSVPTPTWGRDELGTGDMWNSNSLTAWLLVSSGIDAEGLRPPGGGRAPGWHAGATVARGGAA